MVSDEGTVGLSGPGPLWREAERYRGMAELLSAFSHEIDPERGVEGLCRAVLSRLVAVGVADVGALYMVDAATDAFMLVAHHGIGQSLLQGAVVPGEGLAGAAIARGSTTRAAPGDHSLRSGSSLYAGPRVAELYLPLRHGGSPVGLVGLERTAPPFEDAEVLVLEALASLASSACVMAQRLTDYESATANLESILAGADEGIYTIDRRGRITLVNPAVTKLTGYSPGEIIGRNSHGLFHHSRADGSPYPADECPMREAILTGRRQRVSNEVFWHKDGHPIPVEYGSSPLFRGGALEGAVITFLDNTERRAAERQLDAQYEVARVLAGAPTLEEAMSGVLESLCVSLGWKVGLAWAPARREGWLSRVASYASQGWGQAARELGNSRLAPGEGPGGRSVGDGQMRFEEDLEVTPLRHRAISEWGLRAGVAVPVTTSGGELLGVAEFFTDSGVSEGGLPAALRAIANQVGLYVERKRTEQAAEQLREEFVASVSHELRTPLAAINGWTKILLTEDTGPLTDDQRRALAAVERNNDRLMRLVGDILVASQIQAGKLDLELALVDAAEVARDAAEELGHTASAKNLTLVVDAHHPVRVAGDRERLSQLVFNLLSNAIKYTPGGGAIGVSVAEQGALCRIEVSDTGIGIPPEDRELVFERFFRSSTVVEASIVGTGLGLAISKGITEAHEGRIGIADSNGPGTVFFVDLPLGEVQSNTVERRAL